MFRQIQEALPTPVKVYTIDVIALIMMYSDFNELVKLGTMVFAMVYTFFKMLNEYKKWKSKAATNEETGE